jgi:hypothetical protein
LSPEFADLYGNNLPNDAYVEQVYRNVLQREPDGPGLAFWQDMLGDAIMDRAEILAAFADSPENNMLTAANIDNGYWLV